MKTFKLLGLLLTYPGEQLQAAAGSFAEVLTDEGLLTKRQIKSLQPLLDDYANNDLISLQEQYVSTFDRSRNHCLYLFEHIHGESRDRGAAMVDMKEMYASKGLDINSNELPDYLPLFLEFLSFCELDEAIEMLADAIDVIATIGMHLDRNKSVYSTIFSALENMPNIDVDKKKVALAVKNAPKDPETFEELDKEWEETPAFGNDETDCNNCGVYQKSGDDSQNLFSGDIQ
jgi:nitrate reductase delta subunit